MGETCGFPLIYSLCQEVSCRPKATSKPKTHTNNAGQTTF